MKKLTIFLLGLISILNTLTVSAATFSDLPLNDQNYEAISYLQSAGILNGYPDGTFKPNQSVNRAEFLKIVLEGSKIELNSTTTLPFSDVNTSLWYGKYLQKAYTEKWINGYSDGTFKPEQTINKVEALKILGAVQSWQLPKNITTAPFPDTPKTAWYTPYIAYAKEQNLLAETSGNFEPGTLMTRGGISGIIYKTYSESTTETPETPTEIPAEEPTETPTEDDYSTPTISKTFYEGITLNESLPQKYYKNEVYTISGTVSGSSTSVTAVLKNEKTNKSENFTEEVTSGKFEITIFLDEEGDFILGLIPENNSKSKAENISVKGIPKLSGSEIVKNVSAKYQPDQTFISFDPQAGIKKLTLSQEAKSVNYYSRQNTTKIPVQYKDFENFKTGTVNYYIETAAGKSTIQSFQAEKHHYDEIRESVNGTVPYSISKDGIINFTISSSQKTQLTAYVITPNNQIDELKLTTSAQTEKYYNSTVIPENKSFSFSYETDKSGVYIVEVNNSEGIAIINRPVYAGKIIPLIPDFFDLNQRTFFKESFNLKDLQSEMLDLINDARKDSGLDPVTLSSPLSELAQSHTDDMASNGYFSHYSKDGKTPDERRIEMGLSTPVSENIAQDTSIEFAHNGLMRSAAHMANIVDPNWTQVGLGISLKNGYLYVAQEFAGKKISESDLENYKSELIDSINNIREDNFLNPLTYSSTLEDAAAYMNMVQIENNQSLTSTLFEETLDDYSINGKSQALGRSYSSWETIIDSILEADMILEPFINYLGVSIELDSIGKIQTLMIVNEP